MCGWMPGPQIVTGKAFRSSPDRCQSKLELKLYNTGMSHTVPPEIQGQKYISLATFRKNGVAVRTPVWFGEDDGKLYVMTRSDSGKFKRIRNDPQVRIAPCTARGKITGPESAGKAGILPPEDFAFARKTINRKYWMARIPFVWSKTNVYLEIVVE
jgi:PPOX class probable F420-dependent enzyme